MSEPTVAQAERSERKPLAGIEGWLIFPALYLLIVAFLVAEYLVESPLPMLRPEILAGNVAILAGAVVMLALFHKKLAIVPPLMIVFYLLVVAVCALEVLTLTRFSAGIEQAVIDAELPEARHGLGHALGAAIVWIPYFVVSERVRNTFVE
jgi:hypothetical protein